LFPKVFDPRLVGFSSLCLCSRRIQRHFCALSLRGTLLRQCPPSPPPKQSTYESFLRFQYYWNLFSPSGDFPSAVGRHRLSLTFRCRTKLAPFFHFFALPCCRVLVPVKRDTEPTSPEPPQFFYVGELRMIFLAPTFHLPLLPSSGRLVRIIFFRSFFLFPCSRSPLSPSLQN